MTNLENMEIKNENLDIYIAFDRLKATDLAFCLEKFSLIAEKIAEDLFIRSGKYAEEGDFPILEIDSMHTGDSIKFSLVEGWKPTITNDKDGGLIIGMPKKMGIPLIVGFLLLKSAAMCQEVQNKYLDNEQKRIEIQLKQIELDEKIAKKKELLNPEKISFRVLDLQSLVAETTKKIIMNNDFKVFKINGVDIKNLRDNQELITK